MNHKLLLRRTSKLITPSRHIKRRMWQERGGTLDKMVIILPELKVMYTSVPKAANSTVKKCLWSASGVDIEGKNINSAIFKNPGPSRRISEIDDRELSYIFTSDDWFKFSFVRNPYKRLLSGYKDKILGMGNPGKSNSFLKRINWHSSKPPSFDEFIEAICAQEEDAMDWHWMPQSRLLMTDIIHYGFIGKLENFKADMNTVLLKLNVERDKIDALLSVSLNKTKGSEKQVAISDKAAKMIYLKYKKDFDGFGYDPKTY